ncbi:MAG: ornithine carbamoyltransferase [Cellulosilyticaceae bacterium]
MFNLKGKSLITLHDYSREQIEYLIDLAKQLKDKKRMGIQGDLLKGKNIALIFEKPSTRTRCAFTVACVDEGAHPEYLGKDDIQLGYKESVADTARVLGRLFDAIEFRGFSQKTVEELAAYGGVPVYNGLTDLYHPTQILADLLTIQEKIGDLEGKKFIYAGDGRNNMANSLLIGCSKVGMNIVILAPKELWPDPEHVEQCKRYAEESGSEIIISEDIEEVVGADIIYTDVWCSMGEEEKAKERVKMLKKYQVNQELMNKSGNKKVIFMHCLPAVKGNEVTEEVFESKYSVVFDQAENRMHTIKAVMVATLS